MGQGAPPQPAFVALLEAAEARYADCEWDATAIREATLEAGAAVGVERSRQGSGTRSPGSHGPQRWASSVRVFGLAGAPAYAGPYGTARQRAVAEDVQEATVATGVS